MSVTLRRAAVAAALIWSVLPLAALAYHTVRHGGVLSGSDGALAGADQLFYMDSIRQSAAHGLIADHFDLTIGSPVFLNPVYLLAGLLWLAGVSLRASFWALQLLAAPVLALGAVALATRCLPAKGERAAAVALGLFYLSPLVPLLAWTRAITPFQRFELDFPAGESMPAWQLWGYPHAALVVGLLAFALIGAARLADGDVGRPRPMLAAVSGAAVLIGWLHPWQGAIFIIVVAVLGLRGRSLSLARTLLVPIVAGAIPIAYERVLVAADAGWRVDSAQNAVGQGPVWMLLLALLPLVLVAVAGYRALAAGPLRAVIVTWPAAEIAVYFGTSQFPYHSLEGISIPLAVLAVAGWRRLRTALGRSARLGRVASATGAVAVVLAVASGVGYEVSTFRDSVRSRVAPYWLKADDLHALEYLDRSPVPGGVFARYYVGMAVPAYTGRRTWVGEWTWTPDFSRRQIAADQLLGGRMATAQARALIGSTGARFALRDCGASARVGGLLGPMIIAVHQFGCAVVYQLRVAGAPARRVQ